MIGKLVVWAPTREIALVRTRAALRELAISGPPTTIPAALTVLEHPGFGAGAVTTGWLESEVTFPEEDDVKRTERENFGARREEVVVLGRRYVIPRFDASGTAISTSTAAQAGLQRGGARQSPRGIPGVVTSPMQGVLVGVEVAVGDEVTADQVIFVVEAMKMQNQVLAGVDGVVNEIVHGVGDAVGTNSLLAQVTPART
jgi:acetyl-CoA/propionyl-CoA carboxylase biotin carboxyl carrier protein